MEIVGTWWSVVVRNRINKAREESIADVGKFGRKRDGVQKIGEQPKESNEERSNASEDDVYYVFIASDGESNTLPFMIENELVGVIIDSGATCNLMSEQEFDKVSQGKLELLKTDRKVYAYASQEPLKLSGKCMLNICVPDTQTSFKTEFFVMPGSADTLLGRSSSEELSVLKVVVSVNACESRNTTVKKAALKTKYPKVFTGLGKLKNFQCKLHVDESVSPIAQAMLRIPFSRKQKVIDKLKELEALDVIEKVNGPTSWINPLVVVEQSNGDVRICLAMRQANRAILREKHSVPTIEETLQEMSGAKVFSKLDLNMVFHQIELSLESRDINTFAGPNGLYRYKRPLFGVNMATEKFQHIIWQIFKDCPGRHNIHDDIRIVGTPEEEHDERLNEVIKKLEESGLTLNCDKCQIGMSSMEYLGNVLVTDKGLQVSDDKVKAIVQAPRPKDQSELRSFLGLGQYCARFIPSFAIIASPLWDLTKAHAKWKWGTAAENAFQAVKRPLTQAPVMAFFKQGAETRITTDASPVGIGAVLEQKKEDGQYRPVHYASRKLTPPESRYFQFEREALSVKWICEKFFLYIHGNDFEICTDHKPLITVLGPHSKPSSARIERWMLYKQQFKNSIRHIPGRENAADALSTLPVDSSPDAAIKQTEEYARTIVADAIPAALAPRQVKRCHHRW